MYVASLERFDRPPRDELESAIWAIWRAWRADQLRAANRYVAGSTGLNASALGDIGSAMQKHKAMGVFLGTETEESGSPWYLAWRVLVENNDVCLSSVWCTHIAMGFPALVRGLASTGRRAPRNPTINPFRP